MLVRFSVSNFKSYNERQELILISDKKKRLNKEHLINIDDVELLRAAGIFGANASGKSNLVEAINFGKFVVLYGIPKDSTRLYFRQNTENRFTDTTFEFEIYKNGNFYAYGFSLNLFNMEIKSEWVYKLLPNNRQEMIFERETHTNRFTISEDVLKDETDIMRFNTYKLDFEFNKTNLFLQEMNRLKKINESSGLHFFVDIYNWFMEDLRVAMPDQPINPMVVNFDDGVVKRINAIIKNFDTGIEEVITKKYKLDEFRSIVSDIDFNNIINTFNVNTSMAPEGSSIRMSFRSKNLIVIISSLKGKEPEFTTITLKHRNSSEEFYFNEESDGTKRLFDLLDILISGEKNKVYVIDEIERSLHPNLIYQFLEVFFSRLRKYNIQLIFTTHESRILDQELMRRDEIWFCEKGIDNSTKLYSLDRFNERYDKKIDKSYLDGRYGGVPEIKSIVSEEGEDYWPL